jgi:hypothetical protein
MLFLVVLIAACLVRFWQVTQIPHALWVDEAWFALRGRDVARGIDFVPITRPGLGVGDSPMQVYLAAAVQLLGLSVPYSSRIASAIVGTLTVALIYPALATIWREEHEEETARWMALVATVIVAGLFAHIYASRVGMQYALAPAFTILTLWLLWQALTTLRFGWAIGAGIALGLSQYTYESVRVLPILVGLFGLLYIGQAAREHRKQIAVRFGVIVGTAILAFIPLVVVYARDPAIYVLHMQEVSRGVLSGQPLEVLVKVLGNYVRVLGGISLRGDVMPGRNLVGRPMLDPFLSLFCWPGVLLALKQIRKSRASQLLVLWTGIILLPTAFSDQAPASNRMLAAAPALAAFVARGMVWAWQRLDRRPAPTNRQIVQRGIGGLLAVGLVLSQAQSAYDYFIHWAQDPRLFDAMSMGARLLADRALELTATDQVYLTPTSDPFIEPIYDLLLEGSPVKALDGDPCLPLMDHPTRPVDYGVVITSDHKNLPRLKSLYPGGREIDVIMHPDGYAYAVVFQVPAGTPGPMPQHQVKTEFSGGPTLIGYDLSASSALPAESIHLVLYWRATTAPMKDLVSFIHVGKGRHSDPMVANHDAQICGHTYPTSRWSAGEIILDSHVLTVADDAPPDIYEIAVGIYRVSDIMRLDIIQSDHPAQDNRVTIGTLTVAAQIP